MKGQNCFLGGMPLDVPYFEKEEAKALGAHWDPDRKTWYVPHKCQTPIKEFSRWYTKFFNDRDRTNISGSWKGPVNRSESPRDLISRLGEFE